VTSAPAGQPPLLNIANVLTGVRLLLVPVFLAALFTEGGASSDWRLVAFGVFVVAAVTDRFDGELARRRGLVTAFGTIADPIADKALMGAALVGLSILGVVPWWATIVIMGREIGVTMLRLWVLRRGVIPASRGGKIKTVLQTFAIGLFLLPLSQPITGGPQGVAWWLCWTVLAAAIVLTVVTGLDYVLRALRLRRTTAAPAPEPF
jgi:CDP-diacylglycerol---glycerol-3-phosphate 3-phosphatidyltransferase